MTSTDGRAKALGYTLAFAALTPLVFVVAFFISHDVMWVLIATLLPLLASAWWFGVLIYRLIRPHDVEVQ